MMVVASQHNIKIHNFKIHNIENCRILVRYKDYVDVFSEDMPTRTLHQSRHAMGICEEERFWFEECRKSVKGNDRVTWP